MRTDKRSPCPEARASARSVAIAVATAIIGAMAVTTDARAQADTSRPRPAVGRSVVATRFGIVATSQPLASMAGVRMLERGGSAIDAAIAANATIGLMEPMMNGMGGDLFAIVYDAKTHQLFGLNASGWAPEGMTPALLASRGLEQMPERGIFTVTVPGAVAGWDALHRRFGRLPLSTILAPAIRYADEGFPVSEVDAALWAAGAPVLSADSGARTTYLPERSAAGRGHGVSQSRSRGIPPRGCPARARRILPRAAGGGPRVIRQRAGQPDVGERLGGFSGRMGDAHSHHLPRVDGERAAAQHAGGGRLDDAQHHGALSAGRVRLLQRRRSARDDRGQEAGLRRRAAIHRRSAVQSRCRSPSY